MVVLWLWNLWCYQNNNENFHRTISAAEFKIDLILTCGVSIIVTQELVPFSFPVTVKRFWFVLRAVPDTVFFFGCHRPTGSSRKLLKRQRPFLIYLACSWRFLWQHLHFSECRVPKIFQKQLEQIDIRSCWANATSVHPFEPPTHNFTEMRLFSQTIGQNVWWIITKSNFSKDKIHMSPKP